MADGWRWSPDEPAAGTKSTMTVLVPDPTQTLVPFGFARALLEAPPDPDGWDHHAAMLAGEAS